IVTGRCVECNGSPQPRDAPRLEVAHLHLDRPVPLPLVDSRREGEATLAVAAHQVFNAVAHAPRNGPDRRAALFPAEAEGTLFLADASRVTDDFESAGQEPRFRVVGPVRLQLVQVAKGTGCA